MSASISNAQNPTIAAAQNTNANAATSSSSGSSSTVAAGSAQPTARSYANATKKISSPPVASSAAPPVAVGGPQNPQHAKSSSVSPVNGKNPIQPAVPTMGPPTIVNSSGLNGASSQGDHSRKSSMTISAAGSSGYLPNGQPGGPNTRSAPSNLHFGSLSSGESPSPANVAPSQPQGSNLGPQSSNPRVTSPAGSPSPIPVPASSGGRPPTNLPGQPGIVFGVGNDGADSTTRAVSMPPQANAVPQPQHGRRDSSNHGSINNGRGFVPNGGRGRGGFNHNQHYNGPNVPGSPQLSTRGPPYPRGNVPSFQPHAPLGAQPNSPYSAARSPHLSQAQMHQPGQYPNQPPVPYPTQFGHQQGYIHPGMYGMPQPGLDPNYAFYQQQFQMHPQMHYPGAVPASPGRTHQFPAAMQGQFIPGGYGQPPQAQGMSRSPSQVSERPSSAIPQPQTPSMPHANHVSHTHTPSVPSASPAPSSSNFTIPPKKASKAIVIKNADGEVVNFEKKTASPAPPAQPRSPAIVSTPTPPPRVPSATDSSHNRTDSTAKTKDEKRQEFMEQFQKNLNLDKEKAEADKKAAEDKETKEKAEAEAKAAKEKEESDAQAAKEKADAEQAAKEKEEAEKVKNDQEEKERLQREEDERLEREIAEMEALEREEEERERKYQEKKKKEAEEKAKRDAEAAKNAEEELRRQEKEAEELEAARANESAEAKAEKEALFASLKKNTQFGPAATMSAPAPAAEQAPAPSTQAAPARVASKSKPTALKLDTNKPVEPAQPTAGMQALKSARFLQVRNESVIYPEGIKSPNPALNQGTKSKGRQYDKDFLLQFKDVFKEKPSVDWDMKVKETVGDGSGDSARPSTGRTPSGLGPRSGSARGGLPVGGGAMGSMGSFMGPRTLPPGTTSDQRFNASNQGARQPMVNPLAQFGNRPPSFMAAPGQLNRTGSYQSVPQAGGPNSPRNASSRGKGSRRGGAGGGGHKNEEQAAKAMPLTAGMDLKPLERSQTGWKPLSIGAPQAAQAQMAAGHMPPEMVQRKVKAALNKMTPEKFDKLADQILDIAAQSKDESDGRTLRQVIQLTFEKACDEAHWASMYAKFCHRMLTTMSPEIRDENVKDKNSNPVVGGALFRKYLLNRCQEEFERGWEVNLPAKPEGQMDEAAMLSDDYYIAAAAKRKGLGLIQFIGELYKLGMLTLRIMHECVLKLLDFEGMPDESAIESLVKLLRTVGATMEATDAGPKMIAMYFERIQKIMSMEGLPSRLHFMLLDTVDLRKKGWKSKDDAKGPKTIQEIHQEAMAAQQAAEMERTRSNQRGGPRLPMGRGDARSFSGGGMMPPPDYPRDRVGMDDLRKLSKGASGRNLSNSPAQLGPSSMFGSRSSSGRKGLGPSMMRGEESGASSRTATPPQKEKESSTHHVNSFSALAALDASEGAGEVGSPPSDPSSPPVTKSVPAPAEDKETKPAES
ncbi:hypothetical protein GQ43DRAFT_437591 [Delitschia confertaspora ATCC 74209]|uniref:MIF4G domain-containing protein n=1 Tax=Delitschia confertaspora ATCC 74209 TaxID=1513339 RepID=A0A9P4JYF7_9PLEO|nr:hypothetical protein GQ43DRAFT_437591 [Delitschia confertaspora ATCC 74209]